MIYWAAVKCLSEDVEEEVALVVQGQELTCFASYLPYKIQVGMSYQVEFSPMIFDAYSVREVDDVFPSPSIVRIGESFSYIAIGRLSSGRLECGVIAFDDQVLLSDFGYLDGKFVSWKIDRLDVEFI